MSDTTSTRIVIQAFWDLLGRAPEPEAVQHYSSLLDQGLPEQELVELLAGSGEAVTRRRELEESTWLNGDWRVPYRLVPGEADTSGVLVRLPGMALGAVPPVPALPRFPGTAQLCIGMGSLVPRTASELRAWSRGISGLVSNVCSDLHLDASQATFFGHSYSATNALLVGLQSQGRVVCGGPAVRLGTWIDRLLPAGAWRPEMKPLFDFLYWGSGASDPEAAAELDALIGGLLRQASPSVNVQLFTSETDAFYEDSLYLLRSAIGTPIRLELHVGEYEGHDDLEEPFLVWALEHSQR